MFPENYFPLTLEDFFCLHYVTNTITHTHTHTPICTNVFDTGSFLLFSPQAVGKKTHNNTGILLYSPVSSKDKNRITQCYQEKIIKVYLFNWFISLFRVITKSKVIWETRPNSQAEFLHDFSYRGKKKRERKHKNIMAKTSSTPSPT